MATVASIDWLLDELDRDPRVGWLLSVLPRAPFENIRRPLATEVAREITDVFGEAVSAQAVNVLAMRLRDRGFKVRVNPCWWQPEIGEEEIVERWLAANEECE